MKNHWNKNLFSAVESFSGSLIPDMATKKGFVKYLFEAADENQLSLPAGAVITVHDWSNSEWYDCSTINQRGFVPAGFIELMDDGKCTVSICFEFALTAFCLTMYCRNS